MSAYHALAEEEPDDGYDPFGENEPTEAPDNAAAGDVTSTVALAPGDLRQHGRIAVVWAARLRRFPAALAVAIVLSSYARTEDGCRKCWPSQQTIAEVLGITERAVRSSLKKLEEVGFIRRRKRRFRKSAYCYIWDHLPASLDTEPL